MMTFFILACVVSAVFYWTHFWIEFFSLIIAAWKAGKEMAPLVDWDEKLREGAFYEGSE